MSEEKKASDGADSETNIEEQRNAQQTAVHYKLVKDKSLLHAYGHGWPQWWTSAQSWCQFILASSFISISVSSFEDDNARAQYAWSVLLGIFAFSTSIFSLSVISTVEKHQNEIRNVLNTSWDGKKFVTEDNKILRNTLCCYGPKRKMAPCALALVWIFTLFAVGSLFASLMLAVMVRVHFSWVNDGRGAMLIVCCIIMALSLIIYTWPVLDQVSYSYCEKRQRVAG